MKHPFYLAYGLILLGLVGWAEYRGWALYSPPERRDVPRSVRNNPGAYRAIYGGYHRYIGGK